MEFGDFQLEPDLEAVLKQDAAFFERRDYDNASDTDKLRINEDLGLFWNSELPPVRQIRSNVICVDDRPVELRTYHPDADTGEGYIIWVHGGGWNEGSLDIYDRLMRVLTNAAACPVIGVGYTRVPKAQYPIQIAELLHAYRYIDEMIFPRRRHRFICGYSAGANLILSSMAINEAALGANYFDSACLVCGVFDCDFSSPSHTRYNGYFGSSKRRLKTIIENYAPGAISRSDPNVFPVNCSQSVCDRFLIISAEHDMLRDDSFKLATNLNLQGKDAIYQCVSGVSHIFIQRSLGVTAAHQTIVEIGAYFSRQSNP